MTVKELQQLTFIICDNLRVDLDVLVDKPVRKGDLASALLDECIEELEKIRKEV
jgi:hypothetical protein